MKYGNQQTLFALGLFFGAILSGCGAQKITKAGSQDFSSRVPVEDIDSTGSPAAACNVITEDFFRAGSMVYVDTAGTPRNEALRIKIHGFNSAFKDNEKYFIQFFRWHANKGTPVLDDKALEFAFELTQGRHRIQGTAESLSYSLLQELATALGMPNADLPSILDDVTLILNLEDPKADYDAIKIAAYEKIASDGSAEFIEDIDSLIPAFHADPRQYYLESDGSPRAGALMELHPYFDSINNTNLTTADYGAKSRELCWESVF